MDCLPKGLQNILLQVIQDNKLTSWRVCGDSNIVVTLRFSDSIESNNKNVTSTNNIYNRSYRSKPPSAVARDTRRLSEHVPHFNNYTQNDRITYETPDSGLV
jgi:hypothetical protein